MDRRTMLALSAAGLLAAGRTQAQGTVGDDGLYDESFLKDSFLEMALDHEAAIAIEALHGSKLGKNKIRVKPSD